MSPTKEMTIGDVQKVLPTHVVKDSCITYISPETATKADGTVVPMYACSVDNPSQETGYKDFLKTLEAQGYDKTSKKFL